MDVEIGEPNEGEICVKNQAIGVNFIDVYFRKGVYKATTMPFTLGLFYFFFFTKEENLIPIKIESRMMHK